MYFVLSIPWLATPVDLVRLWRSAAEDSGPNPSTDPGEVTWQQPSGYGVMVKVGEQEAIV
jgi:hypothetical protein